MQIEIENSVKKVKFNFVAIKGNWRTSVNDQVLSYSPEGMRSYPIVVSFKTIDAAVEDAKTRGLIPKDFDVETLKDINTISVQS